MTVVPFAVNGFAQESADVGQRRMCNSSAPTAPGSSFFNDSMDGWHFEFPAAVERNGESLQFDNGPCGDSYLHSGEGISVEVRLQTRYQDPAVGLEPNAEKETRESDAVVWHTFRTDGSIVACTFRDEEQVCIKGSDTSPAHHISPNLVAAVRQMQSSFAYSNFPPRLDSRIAALRIGDRFTGDLTVRRVVSRQLADQHPKEYPQLLSSYGAVDFAGTVSIHGVIEDDSTMNSPGLLDFYPDSRSPLSLPLFEAQSIQFGIRFRNSGFYRQELNRIWPPNERDSADQPNFTVVVKNISISYGTYGCCATIHADLVSITQSVN